MLSWKNETRKLRDLIPWEDNPRQISKAHARRLEQGLEKFGQVQTIAIAPDNIIYDGHQRTGVWSLAKQYGPDYEVDVRVASRPLTEAEQRELVILLHTGTVGEWNWDMLSGWQPEELKDYGFDNDMLGGLKLDIASLGNFLESEEATKEPAGKEVRYHECPNCGHTWENIYGN
jgi:hypothetical protein